VAGAFAKDDEAVTHDRRQRMEGTDAQNVDPIAHFSQMNNDDDEAMTDEEKFFEDYEDYDSDLDSDDEGDDDDDDVEAMKGFEIGRSDGKYYHDEAEYDEFDSTIIDNEIKLMELIGVEKFEEFRARFMEELLKNYKGKEYHDKFLEMMYMFYEQDGTELAALLKSRGGDDDSVEVPLNLQNPTALIKFVEDELDKGDKRDKLPLHVIQKSDEDFFWNSDSVDDDFPEYREKGDPITKLIDTGVSPLAEHGPDLDEFMQAMEYHPSDYAEISRVNLHPDSRREPRPIIPKNRKNPPLDFVKSFVRFIFVSGVPVPKMQDEEFNLDNPLHQHEMKKMVANVCGVKTEQVSPASKTSAFVGFRSINDLEALLPPKKILANNITVKLCIDVPEPFSSSNPHSIIELGNLPKGLGAERLVRDIFPADSPLRETFGNISPEDVVSKDSRTVAIRLKSNELALRALSSEMLSLRLSELGAAKVRYFKARREIVRDGMGGPRKQKEMRVLGPKLVVDGDIPTRDFFISHADTIQLRNLDKSLTKEEITDFFQPFCSEPRDVETSVEFITCMEGTRIAKAFVGFDRRGEMDKVLKAFNGRVKLGKRTTIIKSVKERYSIEGKPLCEPRSNRNIEELLQDLNDWERHANPKDVEELVNAGISKEVLGEYLRNVRFHNPTFSAVDQAKSDERLTPNRDRGHDYRSLVQEYVTNLKDSIATRADPGTLYRGLFPRGEEIDMSIFDLDQEVQTRIREKRRKWYGE
jgi:hypothetical protein